MSDETQPIGQSLGWLIGLCILFVGIVGLAVLLYINVTSIRDVNKKNAQILKNEKCQVVEIIQGQGSFRDEQYRYKCESGMFYTTDLKYADDTKDYSKAPDAKSCKMIEVIVPSNRVLSQKSYRYACESGMMYTTYQKI